MDDPRPMEPPEAECEWCRELRETLEREREEHKRGAGAVKPFILRAQAIAKCNQELPEDAKFQGGITLGQWRALAEVEAKPVTQKVREELWRKDRIIKRLKKAVVEAARLPRNVIILEGVREPILKGEWFAGPAEDFDSLRQALATLDAEEE